ncbi:single-stranded-DNA-specific exonuclease RecJ [Denitratisoma oestradiolicum]|uniref:Single-stranded-DNA-specific exonuclease RecJ n=1 Tax=Denitratisoma oestradiolicum TaxID=311182 RepID=A0A6S6XYF6_9PROT|nr:single-stranded-DNA-specific exonuclease RecJ [Denitratisoma oestradiolicum]TWO80300.1 single-stranded-DNA-specific exonuclease RecJ [Denitratisoma oestradiolicum]CAB1369397.1 ssDNA exonuclease, 5' --> 3'-specific [Denitratisoma oestradiolicum]
MTRIVSRSVSPRTSWVLEQAGIPPLLARLYAARGIRSREEVDTQLEGLLPPDQLKGIASAATLLADALSQQQRLLIVADYDCDGATACAVGLRALRSFGARVDYLVPNRFETGYGLSPEVVRLAADHAGGKPDLIITVDNGIASIEGVAEASRLGMTTLITDHHLPGDQLPAAAAIVNPNQPGCTFPSKAMAGVGVMFYVMLALRAELRRRGWFGPARREPNLAALLDLVALGTVADVVALDRNNRILVAQGLARIREGRMQPGLAALFRMAGRDPARAGTFDLGFALGPRLNAAGRLADMSLGIECLATDDEARAMNIVQELDAFNRERREIESTMREDAEILLDGLDAEERASLTLFDPAWHQGVIGILAGRVKEKFHRPTFAFARGQEGELKGSGRSIPGLHLRDALDQVSKRHPDLLLRFGGHAAAAGLTLREADLARFEAAFEEAAQGLLAPSDRQRTLETDGPLESGYFSLESARLIQQAVWGQGFPQPLFSDRFEVESQRLLKEKHLKLTLRKGGSRIDAIWFNACATTGTQVEAAFRLDINEYGGRQSVQLIVEHCVTV